MRTVSKMRLSTFFRLALTLAFGVAMLPLAGCAGLTAYSAPVKPPQGMLFVDVKAPLTAQFNGTPVGANLKKVSKTHTGFFRDFIFTGGTFAWDDVAISEIARRGGIEEVAYADYELMNILGIYGTFTINVYGN